MNTVHAADDALLAELGYKQEFKRAFKPLEVFGIAFSIIGLLPSIASVLFYALPNGGGPAMVWGWLTASALILLVALSMAELASSAPTSGGLYFWTFALAGPRARTVLCWVVGYANTIGSVAAVASIDWGCAVQIMAAANIGSAEGFEATSGELFATYTLILLSHAVLCCVGTRALARMQGVYVGVNVCLCLAVIVALPACTPAEFRNTAGFALGGEGWWNVNGWPDGYAFIMSFLAPLWTICSFDSAVHISEEASNAARAVPQAIVGAVGVAGGLGVAINISLAFCMGGDLDTLNAADQPMAEIFRRGFGREGTLAVWAFVVAVQYVMGSSMLLAASRQTFAFSRDGALPFSRWLYRMNARTGTPVNTVWFVATLSLLLGLLAFAGDQAINAVFSLSVIALYIAYTIPIVARFAGDNDFKPGPFSLGWFSLPCAIMAVSFMTLMSVVFLFPATPLRSPYIVGADADGAQAGTNNAANMNYSVVVLGGVLGLSLVYYYFPRWGGVHWFKGPVATIGEGEGAMIGGGEGGMIGGREGVSGQGGGPGAMSASGEHGDVEKGRNLEKARGDIEKGRDIESGKKGQEECAEKSASSSDESKKSEADVDVREV
ncbi:amino acid permease-domain-containing protein [Schizophyllum amplum]|uniref:Amino acid permease-domain-containing protein n=1 Tax=Schizophyllum amplum TaxID=97359 RepID=A0A550BUQ5_9AGAR|nr:amino acid permease-domain-containing protein [Auriculariopsis ampla]